MTEYSSGHISWRSVWQRAWQALRPSGRRSGWSLGVPVIALAAGLLFTTSATTADGIPLREDRRIALTELVEERQQRLAQTGLEEQRERLAQEVDELTAALAGTDTPVEDEWDRAEEHRQDAGMTPLRGPGLTVTLEDALRPDGVAPPGAQPDDLLVHQQDLQAVVNALWTGGAEAMAIMGVRVIATSAVICVGPVLLLHGRPYSPPYEITAIGEPDAMRAALAAAPGVQLYREAVDAFGLGYRETVEEEIIVPAFDGTSTLRSGRVAR